LIGTRTSNAATRTAVKLRKLLLIELKALSLRKFLWVVILLQRKDSVAGIRVCEYKTNSKLSNTKLLGCAGTKQNSASSLLATLKKLPVKKNQASKILEA